MQSSKSSVQTIALIVLIVFVLLEGLFFIRLFPKFQIPDEERYVLNVMAFSKGEIPYFTAESATGHPPLYEAIIYPAYVLFGQKYFHYVARLMSLIFFILTLVVAYFISTTLFPRTKSIPLFMASFFGFSPQLVFIFSSINSDSLLLLLTTLAIFLLIEINSKSATVLDYVSLFMVLITGFLTKERFIIILPFVLYVAISRLMEIYRQQIKKSSSAVSNTYVPLFALGFIWATILFSFFVFKYLRQELDIASYATSVSFFGFFRIFTQFWWGYFGLLQYPWALFAYGLALVIFVLAVVGLVLYFKQAERSLTKRWLSLFVFGVVAIGILVVFYQLKTTAGQGRHLYVMVIPAYLLLTVGLQQIAREFKVERYALTSVLVLLFIANIYSLIWKTGWLIG